MVVGTSCALPQPSPVPVAGILPLDMVLVIVLICNCELCWFPRDCHPLPRVVWQKIPLALGLGGISCELRLSLGQATHCKCLLIEKAVPQVPPGLPFFAIMALRREALLPGCPWRTTGLSLQRRGAMPWMSSQSAQTSFCVFPLHVLGAVY